MNTQIGEFRVQVSGPHPCWIEITQLGDQGKSIRFSHRELDDLRYGLSQAARACRSRLIGADKDEVSGP